MARNDSDSSQSIFGRFLNSINERREQRKQEYLINSLPKPYAAFIERYIPDNWADEEIFNKLKHILEQNPVNIKVFNEEFAQIGDAPLLQHLWKETPVNEPDTRQLIVENPQCPKEIILDAIADPFSDVAVPAILNPLVTEEDCIEAVKRIDNQSPATARALEKRLKEFGYEVDWAPWNSKHLSYDFDNPVVHKIPENSSTVPLDKNSKNDSKDTPQKTKTSGLDDLISNAQSRYLSQQPSRNITKEKGSYSHEEIGG